MTDQHLLDTLTERERDISRLIVDGLSNHEIAQELVLTHGTIKWYCGQIYSKLGVSNRAEAIKSIQTLRITENSASESLSSGKTRLPTPLTPFIGRQREMGEIRHLLKTNRLLTLTGVGGTGKTRLALVVAAETADDFADGVTFVDLAPLSDAAQVAKAIAYTLGVVENPNEALVETLKRALAGQEHLLLIDNFEHVIESAPMIPQLLASAPRVKMLITSREALRISGEQEYAIPPLTLPSVQADSVHNIHASEAMALFTQRVRLIRSDFELTDDNMQAVAEVCVRLDGLPLAIELAAARCKMLSPQAMLARLGNRLNTLTSGSRDAPARQQTLRSTIEWSYNLLDEGEKMLFARLAVFRGGLSLEAIEAVCGDGLPIDVFNGLASLVDKNLLQQKEDATGEPRFVMLETLHEFAWEQLNESGEADTAQKRHAEYFVALAERAEPELHRADQLLWLERLDQEHDNLRAALEWSLTSAETELALRFVGALGWFWHMHSHAIEGYRWAVRALEQKAAVAPSIRAKALHITGNRLMLEIFDYTAMRKFHQEALQIARQNDDRYNAAWALLGLALAALGSGEHREIERLLSEALQLFRELDDKTGIGWSFCLFGEAHRFRGNLQEAEAFYQQGLELFEAMGNRRGATMMLNNMAFVTYHQGHFQRAKTLFQKSYALQLLVGRREEYANTLTGMAGIIAAQREPERAVILLSAADALLEAMGATMYPAEKMDYERILDSVRAQLDDARFQNAWAEGRKMTLEQAVANALGEDRTNG